MKNAGSTVPIDVDALKVGMFIHLDLGWMSHPFPLSSFRIASEDQIGVIRALGLRKLRWSPEQSALHDADLQAIEGAAQAGTHAPSAPTEGSAMPTLAAAPAPGDEAAQRERHEALAQRASLARCERQFAEATRECRLLTDLVGAQPQVARERAQALSLAFVTKMLDPGDICIRLLTEAAGDRASAHAVNVTLISLLMGRSFGFGAAEMQDLGVGALLHDIGKLDLPQRVRHRDDHFSAAEARAYEEHVTHGVTQAVKMGLSPGATLVVAQHHEHADGSGFPLRLGSERMTPASSIVALVNRYDNLCNPSVPAKALTPHEALSLLFAHSKTKFDAAVLGAFIKMMGVYPPGSVVQLTDDRFALVVDVNSSRPLKPRVAVADGRKPPDEIVILDLEQSPNLGIRRSIRPSALPADVYQRLSPRQRVAYYFEPLAEIETA